MLPSAQIQAAIELAQQLLDDIDASRRAPADGVIGEYFRHRRYIGSKDRGVIATLTYAVLRHRASLSWHVRHAGGDDTARGIIIAALHLHQHRGAQEIERLYSGLHHAPAPLDAAERAMLRRWEQEGTSSRSDHPGMPEAAQLDCPEWMYPDLKALFGDALPQAMQALNAEAPLDLRVNTLKATREAAQARLRDEGFDAQILENIPTALRLEKRQPIFASATFRDGWCEVQDAGSQYVAALADARPGQKVIDFCAGAGGKTLAIAASMNNKGRVLALDVSTSRLEQIHKRLRRAGVHNVQARVIEHERDAWLKRHLASADRVVVDAPCSGSGTWRRNPDLKWRLREAEMQEILALQQRILTSAARLVAPGGRLVYITCSLLKCENEQQLAHFLAGNDHFRVVSLPEIWDKKDPPRCERQGPYIRLTPHQDGTDGFFAAVLERTHSESTV